ncbi:uncharacterized protein LOC129577916 isoform X2 [Sitodiplosis mosellana]|uniref:uncharacterized protein LOC129577916 isoform X2 n=1 Tax=Sitodiplosis mosellana TaxID=263140 RepID=UPI0024443E7E|nr:uncharacterized protein LOC129577916 isoform X2 [Sitodiplosis mosellana]
MRDFFLCIITALIVVAQCETIHFTNSPSHLIGSKNITSYKLLVKNSDPITIIEANKEVEERPRHKYNENYQPNDRIDVNIDDGGIDLPMPDYHVKLMANLGGSHQVEATNTQNVRGAVGITITGGPSDGAPSNLNEFKKSDYQDHDNDGESSNFSAKKVVYSPILLKKFMKEYSEKLKNADASTKNEIQRIHEKIHGQMQPMNENENSDPPLVFDKSIEEMEQKYNLNGFHDRYADDDRHNRYKDRDGWVTLEAVPWSSSSVSKWHPHSHDNVDDTRRKPSVNTARPYQNKPDKFPYHDDFEDEYYNRPKPAYIDRDKPSVYSTWTKPQSLNSNGRPRPQPYRFGDSSTYGSNKFHDRDHHSNRPWNGEIITDNRPSSDFPSQSHGSHPYHDDDHYNTASSNFHSSVTSIRQDRPSESNGEWVLISTTKGYQIPGGNRRQQDPKRKPTTIHGGMLEIDATHETIEDDVRATMQAQAQKKLTQANQPVKTSSNENKNRKLLKVITTKNGEDKSTEILAAVGAGLVPATMAFLAPMVFGRRRRRSIDSTSKLPIQFQQNTHSPLIHPLFM